MICGTMLARNEDWCIGLTARAALLWLDHLVILDHASDDGTHDILVQLWREYGDRITLLREADPVWHEMKYRQSMLDEARKLKAKHIVVIDADEILSGNLIESMPLRIKELPAKYSLEPPWVGIRGSIHRYHANGIWGTNWVSLAFKDSPHLFWRSQNGYDFHHRRPMGEVMNS
jgi:hypothetical protein